MTSDMNEKQSRTVCLSEMELVDRGHINITIIKFIKSVIIQCKVVMHMREQRVGILQLPAHQQLASSVLRCQWIIN